MKRQRGFTIIELTVTLILIGIVIFVSISFSAQMSDIVKSQEAQLQESAWETVLDNMQKGYLTGLANANGVITSPANNNLILTHAAVGACGVAANRTAVRSLLRNFAGDADARGLEFNPWGGRWCLRVGAVTNVELSGLAIVVRPLAVLSGGRGGKINTNTANAIGLNCPNSVTGDSRHICSSGIAAAAAALETTQEKMAIIAAKLKAYSRAQAILTPQGGFVDYFLSAAVGVKRGCPSGSGNLNANPAYDIHSGGPLGSTADSSSDTKGEEITDIITNAARFPNFEETLGITAADAIDGFGGNIHLDNSSCAARHPYHPTNNTPPFSIRIVSALPGGGQLARIVFSDF